MNLIEFNLNCAELALHKVVEVEYLGIILESKLVWNSQLQRIRKKEETTLMVKKRTQGKT